jgi:hypothetical protein
VHEHLDHVGAMRLILRLQQQQAHGAEDRPALAGGQYDHLPALDRAGESAPVAGGLLQWHGQHEAHRGSALHAVLQHRGESCDLGRT